jgi:hypothetical protein
MQRILPCCKGHVVVGHVRVKEVGTDADMAVADGGVTDDVVVGVIIFGGGIAAIFP